MMLKALEKSEKNEHRKSGKLGHLMSSMTVDKSLYFSDLNRYHTLIIRCKVPHLIFKTALAVDVILITV